MASVTLGTEQMDIAQTRLTCMERIESAVMELRRSIEAVQSQVGDRDSLEADVCLATRSAYFRFKTWVILNETIDPEARDVLDGLFHKALNVLEHQGTYYKPVQQRHERFLRKCRNVEAGQMTSEIELSFSR
jgi:hypothetical protein